MKAFLVGEFEGGDPSPVEDTAAASNGSNGALKPKSLPVKVGLTSRSYEMPMRALLVQQGAALSGTWALTGCVLPDTIRKQAETAFRDGLLRLAGCASVVTPAIRGGSVHHQIVCGCTSQEVTRRSQAAGVSWRQRSACARLLCAGRVVSSLSTARHSRLVTAGGAWPRPDWHGGQRAEGGVRALLHAGTGLAQASVEACL
jgi:hypothetical protein